MIKCSHHFSDGIICAAEVAMVIYIVQDTKCFFIICIQSHIKRESAMTYYRF